MILEIKIPVLPVVKAYLRHKYPVEPFELYRNNKYGIFLFNSLTLLRPVVGKVEFHEKYSETLRLQITERIWGRQGLHIHPKKVIDFNNLVLYTLDEDFCNWMDVCSTMVGGKIQDHYFAFRENYGLHEDLFTLKCMEKKYERYRKRVKMALSA
ncbi:hypothetical protein KHS38_11870 [Mucilaginibacter sp. Bleaf8]|uniref:hypothetical protein n=1 Tax=Mucilaginibacter sp. Bleaf8 TaxID=2834430 RepID=UPI001BD0BF51|nr:hypothetical protein [Mucilaginibacter sp. Bleaf8]MBS7565103.1 hypothetical protein [Mucilaginibacter sp. Bleaf8]